jgi:hypothetical protein
VEGVTYFPLIRRRKPVHFSALQIVNRATGFWRNGTSDASSNRTSGSIQIPRPGRIEKMPPRMRSRPTGMREA